MQGLAAAAHAVVLCTQTRKGPPSFPPSERCLLRPRRRGETEIDYRVAAGSSVSRVDNSPRRWASATAAIGLPTPIRSRSLVSIASVARSLRRRRLAISIVTLPSASNCSTARSAGVISNIIVPPFNRRTATAQFDKAIDLYDALLRVGLTSWTPARGSQFLRRSVALHSVASAAE